MLHEFVTAHRAELLARARAKVAVRLAPRPTRRELEIGVELFLDQLVEALQRAQRYPGGLEATGDSATEHGRHLLEHGFTVAQVVHGYGDVCQAVTQLATEIAAPITTEELQLLNVCVDDAIADAVTEYARAREEAIADEGNVRFGVLAHELRNRLSAATVGFELIKRGTVAAKGSVAAVVTRNLARMSSLIQRSLVEVRLEAGIDYRERISVAALLEEAEVDGSLEAAARNMALAVTTVEPAVEVEVDRQVVAGAIANLMQNAFKFTGPGGQVSLRASVADGRVLIEVEDECGGLPPGKSDELFAAFSQRGADRSGLGLGLFISRRGVEESRGRLGVRDLPGRGCVFTIELPLASPDRSQHPSADE
jgi:signal transduction histidine kinase